MNLNDILQAWILISGVVGQLLISHQRREAFIVWIFSNAALIYVSFTAKLWGMTWLYAFFTLMCFYSIYKWKLISKKAELK